ncbi:MAG: phosphodiesterase [Opitutus sp.]|nr:phosphodiesterase [Opitutus sp.]
MKLRSFWLAATLAALCVVTASAGQLLWGPMLGYRSHREVFLSLEVKNAKSITLDYWLTGKPETKQTLTQINPAVTPAGGQIVQFRPGMLELGSTYEYEITIDGEKIASAAPARFQTTTLWEWRTPPPNFSFLVGSCLYINEPRFDRPGDGYGKTRETLKLAAETGADFMVWLGDNWYYREADYSSVSGLWHRVQHDRSIPEMQKLLGVMHHYATWDDHDYGPNDPNWSFEFKDEALAIFKANWGNPSYGERDNPGVYTKWYWSDAAFILMDDYFYRDDFRLNQDTEAGKVQWGRRQLEWLKQSLLQVQTQGHYTFKFIGNGTQFLQTLVSGSSHQAYRREREELLQFIAQHNITGVVFLTGDVHHSGVYRRKVGETWVYEITSSPLGAASWNVENSPKVNDAAVVKGTLVGDQNFVQVRVTGEGAERALVVTCTDKQGIQRFEHTIKATDLGYVPPRRTSSRGN